MYRLFFVDDHWYLFFRYHHILCERLHKIYKHSNTFTEQESNEAKSKSNQKSVADALKLRNKCKSMVKNYFCYKELKHVVKPRVRLLVK